MHALFCDTRENITTVLPGDWFNEQNWKTVSIDILLGIKFNPETL